MHSCKKAGLFTFDKIYNLYTIKTIVSLKFKFGNFASFFLNKNCAAANFYEYQYQKLTLKKR